MNYLLKLSMLLFLSLFVQAAMAKGTFDFLDPCIAAKDDFWDQRKDILRNIDTQIAAIETSKATPEFTDFWWKEKEKILKDFFDKKYATLIKASGGDPQKGYESWLDKVIKDGGGKTEIKHIVIDKEYQRLVKLKAEQERGATVANLDEQKKELYDHCPSDVANQLFRGTAIIVGAPIGWIDKNFKSAGNEKGELSKVSKALTGISLDDVAKKGLLGGKNSEAKKAANAIAGGKNSEVRKALRKLDPSGW